MGPNQSQINTPQSNISSTAKATIAEFDPLKKIHENTEIDNTAQILVMVYWGGISVIHSQYPAKTIAGDLINDINYNLKSLIPFTSYLHIKYMSGKINLDDHSENFLKDFIPPQAKNFQLWIALSIFALQIPANWKETYSRSLYLIGKPLKHKEIVVYNRKTKNLTIEKKFKRLCSKFGANSSNKTSFYSHGTAYCNGVNKLYLSGGRVGVVSDDSETELAFTVVDLQLQTYDMMKDVLKYPRCQHSMIFIPSKYVFIIGGKTKFVEFYDIDNDESVVHSEINQKRNEPGLAFVNNQDLFAIEGRTGIMNDYTFNYERINLSLLTPKWEERTIMPGYKLYFDLYSSFGISQLGDNSNSLIIFHIVDNNYISSNFIWNYEKDTITSTSSYKFTMLLVHDIHFGNEKFFLPLGEREKIHIPDVISEQDYLHVLVSSEKMLKELDFGLYSEKIKEIEGELKMQKTTVEENKKISLILDKK